MDEEILWTDKKRTIFGLPLSFTRYTLYEDRLIISKGFFNKSEDEIRLYRITDVSMTASLGQRIFGVGTLHCCSGDKSAGDFEITSIKRPKDVRRVLSDQVEFERANHHVISREFLEDDGETDTVY